MQFDRNRLVQLPLSFAFECGQKQTGICQRQINACQEFVSFFYASLHFFIDRRSHIDGILQKLEQIQPVDRCQIREDGGINQRRHRPTPQSPRSLLLLLVQRQALNEAKRCLVQGVLSFVPNSRRQWRQPDSTTSPHRCDSDGRRQRCARPAGSKAGFEARPASPDLHSHRVELRPSLAPEQVVGSSSPPKRGSRHSWK